MYQFLLNKEEKTDNEAEASDVAEGGGKGSASESEIAEVTNHYHWDDLQHELSDNYSRHRSGEADKPLEFCGEWSVSQISPCHSLNSVNRQQQAILGGALCVSHGEQ